MVNATSIELRKIAYRQSAKDGLVITFAVHPDDMPANLASAAIGTRFMAALVEIGDDEQPVEKSKVHHLVQQAGILCNDQRFQKFLAEEFPLDWSKATGTPSEKAVQAIRQYCLIQSRKELATNSSAAIQFQIITGKFEGWKRGL